MAELPAIDEAKMAGVNTHRIVRSLIDPPQGGLVVDAGAGEGIFTSWLERAGYRALALGIDRTQYVHGTADFIECNLDAGIPLPDSSVEGVVAIEIIEHLENPLHFFREGARTLVDGGWLVVTTPNIESLSSKVSLVARNYPLYFGPRDFVANGHINPVSLLQVRRIAYRAGLSVERVTYNVGRLPVPRLRHRFPLTHPRFLNRHWGDALIVMLRKNGIPPPTFSRG